MLGARLTRRGRVRRAPGAGTARLACRVACAVLAGLTGCAQRFLLLVARVARAGDGPVDRVCILAAGYTRGPVRRVRAGRAEFAGAVVRAVLYLAGSARDAGVSAVVIPGDAPTLSD